DMQFGIRTRSVEGTEVAADDHASKWQTVRHRPTEPPLHLGEVRLAHAEHILRQRLARDTQKTLILDHEMLGRTRADERSIMTGPMDRRVTYSLQRMREHSRERKFLGHH